MRLQANSVCWLSGPSGIGKSRLSAEYCRASSDEYSFVAWLDGTDEQSMLLSASHYVGFDKRNSRDDNALKILLSRTAERGLVVVDGLTTEASHALDTLVAHAGPHHLLVNSQTWTPGSFRIRPLPVSDSTVDWVAETFELAEGDALRVLEFSGGLPIAVLAVGRAVAAGLIDIEVYGRPLTVTNRLAPESAESIETQVATDAITVNIQSILQERQQETADALSLLAAAAANPVPETFIRNLITSSAKEPILNSIVAWTGATHDLEGRTITVHSLVRDVILACRPTAAVRGRELLIEAISADEGSKLEVLLPLVISTDSWRAGMALAIQATAQRRNYLAQWLTRSAMQLLVQNETNQSVMAVGLGNLGRIMFAAKDVSAAGAMASEAIRLLDSDSSIVDEEKPLKAELLHIVGHRADARDESNSTQQALRESMFAFHEAYLLHSSLHATCCDELRIYAEDFCISAGRVMMRTIMAQYSELLGFKSLIRDDRSPLTADAVAEELGSLIALLSDGAHITVIISLNELEECIKAFTSVWNTLSDLSVLEKSSNPERFASLISNLGSIRYRRRGGARTTSDGWGEDGESVSLSPELLLASVVKKLAKEWRGTNTRDLTGLAPLVEKMQELRASIGKSHGSWQPHDSQEIRGRVAEAIVAACGNLRYGTNSAEERDLATNFLGISSLLLGPASIAHNPGFPDPLYDSLLRESLVSALVIRSPEYAHWSLSIAAASARKVEDVTNFRARVRMTVAILVDGFDNVSEYPNLSIEQVKEKWLRIGQSDDVVSAMLRYSEVMEKLVRQMRRRQDSEDSEEPEPPTRWDVKQIVLGLPAAVARSRVGKDLLHQHGHASGYSSLDSMWAHRCCVLLSLKYGSTAEELAFERHCLGHAYEARGHNKSALAQYAASRDLLKSVYGDHHYLMPELNAHIVRLSEGDVAEED